MNDQEKIDQLTAALRAARPHASDYHDRMAQFLGDIYDKMAVEERTLYPFVLQMFFEHLGQASALRQQIDEALSLAG